jgi:hypothetical protein
MANIFRVYKDSQVTTDRIRAENAANSIVTPERVVYVYGTADDVAPNFTTVSGALTYANSLTPIVTEPVVIRLFTKADGTPYDLTGLSSWTTYANQYIYFVSDFVRLNETTTLPTTLPAGLQVWYIDPNGVETLWVGREDGSAWPAVGYKEYRSILTQTGTNAPVASVTINTLGVITPEYGTVGTFLFTSSALFTNGKTEFGVIGNPYYTDGAEVYNTQMNWETTSQIKLETLENGAPFNGGLEGQSSANIAIGIYIRVYP